MKADFELGDKILASIIEGGMVCSDCRCGAPLVWSANSQEQLGALVRGIIEQALFEAMDVLQFHTEIYESFENPDLARGLAKARSLVEELATTTRSDEGGKDAREDGKK